MKTLLFIAASAAACVSFAQNSKLQPYQNTLKQVMALEANGETKKALYVSALASKQISEAIGMDQVVSSISSKLNKMDQEIITKRTSASANFSLLFLISGSAGASYDTTKIINTNPEEVAAFDGKVASDFATLQHNLAAYVQTNELGLVYTKAFATKALQLATKLSSEDRADVRSLVLQTYNNTQAISFYGSQQVTRCATTEYLGRSTSLYAKGNGILFSFGLSTNEDNLAHTEKSCSSSSHQTGATQTDLISAQLAVVENQALYYEKQLGLIELSDAKAPSYPVWGSPYYK